jgi:hypothetical protein
VVVTAKFKKTKWKKNLKNLSFFSVFKAFFS